MFRNLFIMKGKAEISFSLIFENSKHIKMTKVLSNLVSSKCKNFRELGKKNNFHLKNYTPLNGSKSLNYYDIDGYDHNSDNLKQDNLSLKYLTINVQHYSELTILVVNRTRIRQIKY